MDKSKLFITDKFIKKFVDIHFNTSSKILNYNKIREVFFNVENYKKPDEMEYVLKAIIFNQSYSKLAKELKVSNTTALSRFNYATDEIRKEIQEKNLLGEIEYKDVTIYSIAVSSKYLHNLAYHTVLEYKGKRKKITKEIDESTPNRCIIQGIIDALYLLKEPCNLTIVTMTPLGIKTYKDKNKGINKDLLSKMFFEIGVNKCKVEFLVEVGKDKTVKKICLEEN